MKDQIYINHNLADQNTSPYQVSMLIRSIDEIGSGKLDITVTHLALLLNVTRKTVRRNLYKALHLGFLQYLEIKGDKVYVRYTSTVVLRKHHGGLRSKVPTSIAIRHTKLAATRAEACSRTKRHDYKLRHLPRRKATDPMFNKSVINYNDLLSLHARWVRVCVNGGVLINHPNIIHAGASQQTMADSLGRHRTTINRRLGRCNRELCNLPHLRVHRMVRLSDLSEEVQENLHMYRRWGRYTLGRRNIVWENGTCLYPFEPFGSFDG